MLINDRLAASVNKNGSRGSNKRMIPIVTGEEGIAHLDLIVTDKYYVTIHLSLHKWYDVMVKYVFVLFPPPSLKFGFPSGHNYKIIIIRAASTIYMRRHDDRDRQVSTSVHLAVQPNHSRTRYIP